MITIKAIQKYDCDVLIAGGGPAGSGLAYHLAKAGLKVIVAEAEKFPRDKVCGDGVSPIALKELHAMGITNTEKFAKANEINKVGLFIKNDEVFIDLSKPEHLPFHARIIPRIELDNWIYEAAKKAGAAYIENARVTSYGINENAVVAQLKQQQKTITIKSKIIVGADGSRSAIARQMHGVQPSDEFQLLGLRAYYENVNGPSDRVDIYFSDKVFPGIFWMFPKAPHGANIGMAMISQTLPNKPQQVREMLAEHINQNPEIKKRIGNGTIEGKIEGWPIKFYNPDIPISGNRILLVGDAAGLINPLSGDGIQYALLSARWAAEALQTCFAKNDFSAVAMNTYSQKVNQEQGYDFALSNLLVQFPRNKTLSPVWMKLLSVIISCAKEDKNYADTIAGIFEGTYPSHKALNSAFILKSITQGGKDIAKTLEHILKDPQQMLSGGTEVSNFIVSLIDEIKNNPAVHGRWLLRTAAKTFSVAGHVVKNMKKT
ncbi:geranylgeranyl reductase family protein [Ferruginibacter sp. SUN106]|uniref:geranylgeranyl reductase family protein n=1 Tax=Ferruginibacter sp. SUN106 TaxID=2978348 RepID=UPI003D369E0C